MSAGLDETNLERARGGDHGAFEKLVAPQMDRLHAIAYRTLGNRADAADVVQETLLRAFQRLESFRGDSSFSTWIVHIATNLCLDALRAKRRWRVDAQPMSKDECLDGSSALHGDLLATLGDPSFHFEANEHIAFCFTCVARTLDADMEIALVLCDVFDFKNAEAAAMLGVTESVHRHSLSEARARMQTAFDGLCALVNKTGVCYQCAELREHTPKGHRSGEVPELGTQADPPETRWKRRLTIVKSANLESGRSRALHDLMFRWIGMNAQTP